MLFSSRIKKFKKGSALLLTVLTITTVLLIVVGMSRLLIPQLQENRLMNDSLIANYAAKAGVEYYIQKQEEFTDDNVVVNKNLDNNTNTCGNDRTKRCFTARTITRHDPFQTNTYNVAIAHTSDMTKNINQSLFFKMNAILSDNKDDQNKYLALHGNDYIFKNPLHDPMPSGDCSKWVESLDTLLETGDIYKYDLLYLVNGTENTTNPLPNGKIDLTRYFDPGAFSNGTLGDFLITGGHLLIDNTYGAKVTFPDEGTMNTWYSYENTDDSKTVAQRTGLDKISLDWSTSAPGHYGTGSKATLPANYVNGGRSYAGDSDANFDSTKNIFKFVYENRPAGERNLVNLRADLKGIMDYTIKASGGTLDSLQYLLNGGGSSPRKIGDGYTEMLTYSQQTYPNVAMQYFGEIMKGWIVVVSSSPASAIASQSSGGGAGQVLDNCNLNSSTDSTDLITPSLFILSLADFAKQVKTVEIVGKYGGVERKYRAERVKIDRYRYRIDWVETP